MKLWHRLTLAIILGLAVGASLAVYRVRGGLAEGQIVNGPWATAKTYGSTEADALTRARVALGGLLALPAREAMYFTAKTDSGGRPLDGKCSYTVRGGAIDARWWSLTLYQGEGWLVPNAANRWSVGSAAVPADAWTITVAPDPAPGQWLPTGDVPTFDLTLRAYHPRGGLFDNPATAKLPVIDRGGCK